MAEGQPLKEHRVRSQTLPSSRGSPRGTGRGPAHLSCERASIARVRTGESSLSIGSALMIACRTQRGGERLGHSVSRSRQERGP